MQLATCSLPPSFPLPHPITHVQPPLEFIPPALNPLVLRAAQLSLPTWLRSRTNIAQIQAENLETLVELYQQFQAGKIRFLMAFRHPSTDDPLCMAYLLSYLVPQAARQQGTALQYPIHAHFIYDRGIPLWAGSQVGWLYSRLGGTPIHRGKLDRVGLRSARDLFVNGKLPMAAAPEGATNGHNGIVSPLEPGISQLGFWCVEDLVNAGRSEQVFIVPIGIQYRYVEAPWKSLSKLLTQLEAASGLSTVVPANSTQDISTEQAIYHRLYRLGEHLLSLMEEFYTHFDRQPLLTAATKVEAFTTEVLDADEQFAARLQALLNRALQVAEQYFGIQPKGSLIDRCRRLEQAGWDWIYREDIKHIEALSPLERGLADRIAEEASLKMWHMRLVESFVAVTGKYVQEKFTVERFAETTLLMWDTVTRMSGGNPFRRPYLGKQSVQITVGQPISVSDRWETYQANRRSAKLAVTDLTCDLQAALVKTIG